MIKVRCSKLDHLFSDPRSKKDQESGVLSGMAQTLLSEIFLLNKYGYKEEVITDILKKGNLCEQESMQLVSDYFGEFRYSFGENLENEFITGTPDIVIDGVVEDIKTSFNLRTFHQTKEADKKYILQLQGYLWLTNCNKARLIHCLAPTPEDIIVNQKLSLYYKFDCKEDHPDYIRMSKQIDHNNDLIKDIPLNDRIKVFEIDKDPDFESNCIKRVLNIRDHYKKMSL